MAYTDVLEHEARRVRRTGETTGALIDGERNLEEAGEDGEGESFPCALFIELGQERPDAAGNRNEKPSTVLLPAPGDGGIELKSSDELDIIAPDVAAALGITDVDEPMRWKIEGTPQPFGRPGRDVIGLQVRARRVED